MKKFLLILLCVPFIGFGQGWKKTFGGTLVADVGYSVQQTTDGGYIIAGDTEEFEFGPSDIYLIKTDGNGDSLWTKTFGDTLSNEVAYSVQQTTDGGYIITGRRYSSGFGGNKPYLLKTDGNGDSLWTNTFAVGSVGFSVQQTTDGGYIISCTGSPAVNQNEEIYLIKTDFNGDPLWTKTFGDSLRGDFGYSVQQTTDGGYIITGNTYSYVSSSRDLYLIKTDFNGDSLWTKTFGVTDGNIDGHSVQQTADGGYIITGDRYSSGIGYNVYLLKTDGSGIEQWSQTFYGTSNNEPRGGSSVQQTTDGGYIITGHTFSYTNGSTDVYLLKTDGSGIEQWSQNFDGTGNQSDYGNFVQQTTDGGYIITGQTSTLYSNGCFLDDDIFLIKTDGNGNVTSEFTIPINPNRKLEKVVDILGRDVKLEKNKPFIEIYNDGTVEKKIIIE